MDRITIKCPAKINLSLDVVGVLQDGYHLLEMIMQSVSLFDEIEVVKNNDGINIYCDNGAIPCSKENTAYKAAKLMTDKFNIDGGADIFIKKRIPWGAGLGGGSADAAGVIKAMNSIYALNLKIQGMQDIGLNVGADVPFCISHGTAFAEGIGEKLTYLKPIENTWCVIAKPPVSISTQEMYKRLKMDEIVRHPDTQKLIEYINNGDVYSLAQNMVNVFEPIAVKEHSVIFDIKDIMMKFDAMGSIMTGSGSAVFGLFESHEAAEKCCHRLNDYLKDVFVVKTYNE